MVDPSNGPCIPAIETAEALFRNLLPRSEHEFVQELAIWHPELHPSQYSYGQRFPRCWIVTAAITLATAYTEYARYILESLRDEPSLLKDSDANAAEFSGPRLLELLDDDPWRRAICKVGSRLYFFGPETLTRAFAVGLNFAFVQPGAARTFAELVRSSDQAAFDRQVVAAGAVINRYPISIILSSSSAISLNEH